MGKNHSNKYCEFCGKFHKPGKHISTVVGNTTKLDILERLLNIRRSMYFYRDVLGDAKEFKESDIVKEVDEDES